jgi:hypothetical protein
LLPTSGTHRHTAVSSVRGGKKIICASLATRKEVTGSSRNSGIYKPYPKIVNPGPILLILVSKDNILREDKHNIKTKTK